MAKEGGVIKYDPNTEAFQMRAQWKKVDICRKQWFDQWSWLLDERKQTLQESEAIRQAVSDALPHAVTKSETTKSLKPVPITSTGVIGWLAAKPDCQLEIYTSWLTKIPVRLPDTWDDKNYLG
ncbi:uncharacterized protein LOC123719008 [Pieris brassicae]|uniref:uncharacterized protein LOC123719008 n=1 Tax=Pieris brassicae TaxID=7116 RepID=UPI001E66001A|nr:uncharacterized protein LOC123719008 [Pieris brassicae]XP_045532048.1 uncharacterized protein LOC123719008 [Pieris brassicae]XP_045532049.1 uncharacterized protein LOC123719008 [Pieris brassicae]XP_045532050.1 uncharacterized protein LOC123719008 [Pieris brassicae]